MMNKSILRHLRSIKLNKYYLDKEIEILQSKVSNLTPKTCKNQQNLEIFSNFSQKVKVSKIKKKLKSKSSTKFVMKKTKVY